MYDHNLDPRNVVVVYHKTSESYDCLDGFASAFVAWLTFGYSATYIPAFHHTKHPIETFIDRDVLLFDFSYNVEYMDIIQEAARSLLVIDHHKTTMLEIGIRQYSKLDMAKSGCVLAWEHFYPNDPLPVLLERIGAHDIRSKDAPEDNEAFIQRLRLVEADFHTWSDLLEHLRDSNYLKTFIDEGRILLAKHKKQCSILADSAFPIVLAGIEGLAVNANKFYSHDVGHILAERSGTFGASFFYRPDNSVEFSLTSTGDFDVEKLAAKYKGGGLNNASGFSMSVTSFSSIVDLSSKNVAFYIGLQTYLVEFCQSYVPPSKTSDLPKDLAKSFACFLSAKFGSVADELRITVKMKYLNKVSIPAKMLYWVMQLFGLPTVEHSPKWYHFLLPYHITRPLSFNDGQIAELLEISRQNRESETTEFVLNNLVQTVKYEYEAHLLSEVRQATVLVTFPNSSFFIQHTFTI